MPGDSEHGRTNSGTPGVPADGDEVREVARLVEVARACVRDWQTTTLSMSVPTGLEDTFRVGFPLAAHALNCVQVAIDCWDRFPWVAAANVRIAFEHAAVAQWVFVRPDGPEHFVRVAAHSDLVTAKEFEEAIALQPDLTALVDPDLLTDFGAYASRDPKPGKEREWSVKRVLAPFDDTGFLYGSYRALSKAVHPSTGTVGAHLDVMATNRPQLSSSGHGNLDRTEAAQSMALAALWALNFVEKCNVSYVAPGTAGTIATPHGLPYDLAHSVAADQGS